MAETEPEPESSPRLTALRESNPPGTASPPHSGGQWARVWNDLCGERVRGFLGNLGKALFWQFLGKLVQVVGMAYAFRCLGPDNVGLSGTVLVAAAFGQLTLDLGLEIVSVRHVAGGTATLAEITTAAFTVRCLVAAGATGLWLVVLAILPAGADTRWVWMLGAWHMMFLTMGFSWFYQAREKMPAFSLILNLITIGTSVCFLVFFHPNQEVGSDLLVTMLVNGAATVAVWWHVHSRLGLRLFDWRSLPLARRLFLEGRPTWSFNLSYYALASMGLPLCNYLLGDAGNRESGYYRSAMALVAALQSFLTYFAFMLNPRIVAWRANEPGRFRHRILLLVSVLSLGSMVVLGCVWLVREPIILLLWGQAYRPAAGVLAPLVSAKFLAVSSGIVVWALFAHREDWLAVRCCVLPLVVAFGLNWWLIPRYGITAAGWLNLGAECGLLAACLLAFARVSSRNQDREPVAEKTRTA